MACAPIPPRAPIPAPCPPLTCPPPCPPPPRADAMAGARATAAPIAAVAARIIMLFRNMVRFLPKAARLTTAAYAGLNARSLPCEIDRAERRGGTAYAHSKQHGRSITRACRACKANRFGGFEFEPQRSRSRRGPSAVERRDRVAFANGPAELDAAIEPGAVEQRRIDGPPQQLLKVPAGEVHASTDQHRLADLEALTDQVVERHAERRQVAAMFSRRKLDLLARKRRVAPGNRVEHFHFDEGHLAHVGFWRVGADAVEIPIAFDPAASDQLGFVELLHRERRSLGDMNMEQAAGPAHRVSPNRRSCAATNIPRSSHDARLFRCLP